QMSPQPSAMPQMSPQPSAMPQMSPQANTMPQMQSQPNIQPASVQSKPAQPASNGANFGETTFLNAAPAYGETTTLSSYTPDAKVIPYLVRYKNNEKIVLNKPVFRIGKEKSYVDYFISDNSAISRSHANILNMDGKFYVIDTNSTNHTFLNGQMLQSNMETEIKHGDKIRLADEEFEFKTF
ncbi:MAG: FHA domain-containing protein, partial [Lachnospiraceae bacterium]|nr:FHA domain-containing protein [Lachnospiraceae bacterium]